MFDTPDQRHVIVCFCSVPCGAYHHFRICTADLSDPIKSHLCVKLREDIVYTDLRCQISYCSASCWKKIPLLTNSYCVAGWRWRWKGAAEEMDDVPEGSALVFSARWRLSLQHNPRHVCAHTQSGGLEEHSVLWSLHLSVVRAFKSFD